ncbi:MFS transporter [Alphaproteobacteria bacterium]|nr:MFS transporter [Alphaproteobacteria bacterium]
MDTASSWRRLTICSVIGLFINIGIWSVVVVLPEIEREFNSSRASSALPYTFTLAGFAIGNFVIGSIVDRIGIAKATIYASLLISGNFLLCSLSDSLLIITSSHFFLGLGTAVGFGPLIADITHWFVRRRGIAVAIIASGNYLSGVVWSPLIGIMLSNFTWRDIYLSIAIVLPTVAIPFAFLLLNRTTKIKSDTENDFSANNSKLLKISGGRLQFLLGMAGIGCCIAMAMPQVHIVAYCVGLGFGATIGASMLSVMLASGIISRIMFGLCADRIGSLSTLILSSALQMISLIFFIPFDGMTSLFVVSAIFGLSQGGIVPSYALVVRHFLPAREAGQRIGIVLMLTIFGMAIGGWMSGFIFDQTGSYKMAFLNGILWNIFNLGILGWLFFNVKSTPSNLRTLSDKHDT